MSKHSIKDLMGNLLQKKFRVILFLGMSAGLPLMLVFSTVKIWLRRDGIDLATIGYFSWLTIPYSINFLWAPLLDNIYSKKLGRRRGWIFLAQFGLATSMLLIGFFDPINSILGISILTFFIALFSATQDIAIDAYRTEALSDEEQGIGASLYVYGYRIGMLISSGFGLWMVDPETLDISFGLMYQIMGVLMLVLMINTFLAIEPQARKKETEGIFQAVFLPFKEFFSRENAFTMLFFVLLFKVGDGIAGSMYGTYYVDLGYTNKMIAEVTKGVGFISTMGGLAVGASLMYMWGIRKCLVLFGVLQALSTLFFAFLPSLGKGYLALASVVSFEDFSSGLGTTAAVAFISSITDKRYTATQYALLASLAAFGRTFFSGFAGELVKIISYQNFFIFCSLVAIPGLILAYVISKQNISLEEKSA